MYTTHDPITDLQCTHLRMAEGGREGTSHRTELFGAFSHFGGSRDRKLHGNARLPARSLARLPAETDVEIDGGWNGKG